MLIKNAFSKFAWGFLLTILDFRIQGFDILPDIIGYIMFAVGFSLLSDRSAYFKKAGFYNIFMILISILQVYEQPVHGGGFHFNPFAFFVGTLSLVLSLVVVYHLFMGMKEMASHQEKTDIHEEAGKRWTQFLYLHLAALLVFVLISIPPLVIAYIIALFIISIFITVYIIKFMHRCGGSLE